MFIGELQGFPVNEGNSWMAVAEVTILDDDDEPVAGVRISGEWDEGDAEATACTTDDTGTCDLESGSIKKRVGQTVFEITDIEHDALTYHPELDRIADPEDPQRELQIRKP